jgi:small subunit ribosomal protein S25e
MKITASLAKKAIDDLVKKGLIRPVVHHHSLVIYTRATQ